MAVITKTNPKGTSDAKPFPKLMIGKKTEVIVLFSESKKGTIQAQGSHSGKVGRHCDDWIMSEFKDYDGEITTGAIKVYRKP